MKQTRQIITATTAAILVTTTLLSGAVLAQPGAPINFYGSIEDADGQPAPEGTEVFALVNGSVEDSIEISSTGQYGGSDAFDDKLSVNSGAGDTVVFRVNSPTGPEASETVSLDEINETVQQGLTFPSGTFSSGSDTSAGGGGGGSGGGGAGGGAAGGGAAGGGAAGQPATAPTIAQIDSTLDLVEPSSDATTDIVDDDPDTSGVSVTPQGTQSVQQITFNDESLTGSVQISEYTDPPEQVANDVESSVAADISGGTDGDDTGDSADGTTSSPDVNVVSVSEITPTTEEAEDTSATVELSVDRERVNNPQQLTVIKETFDFEAQETRWEQQETNLQEVTEDEVVVEASIESFSLFAVAEVDAGDQQQQVDEGGEDEQDEQDEQPGTTSPLIIIGILAVLAVVGFFLYSRNGDSG